MTTYDYKTLLCENDAGVLTLTLNRPDRLNAFNLRMRAELTDFFRRVNDDDDVRVVIVTGAGRGFCAGADLAAGGDTFNFEARAEKARAQPADGYNLADEANVDGVHRDGGGVVTLAMFDCAKPIIGAINGPAVGIGATMQLAMDVRIASQAARFGFVFTRRGVTPEACSSWFLPRLVGMSRALEWVLTGRIFDAAEALEGGLVREVVAPDALLPRARELAREMCEGTSPVSVALARRMLLHNAAFAHPMDAHAIESRAIVARGASADAREGVESFLEKRPAKFPLRVSQDMPPGAASWWNKPNFR